MIGGCVVCGNALTFAGAFFSKPAGFTLAGPAIAFGAGGRLLAGGFVAGVPGDLAFVLPEMSVLLRLVAPA